MKKYLNITIQRSDWETSFKKNKKYRGYYSQIEHNRRIEEMDFNYLINPQYSHLNTHKDFMNKNQIIEALEDIKKDYKSFHNRKQPKKTKPFVNGYISFSNTISEDLNLYEKENRDKLFNIVENFLKKELQGLISIDLHLDETTPHFHFYGLNYDYKKHRSYSQVIEEEIKSSDIRQNFQQDRLEQYLKENINNFNYSRGKILSKKQYLKDRQKHKNHLEQLENQEVEYKLKFEKYAEIINEIIADLKEFEKQKDLEKFLKLVNRYFNNENKLENLVNKWKKGLSNQKIKTPTPTIGN